MTRIVLLTLILALFLAAPAGLLGQEPEPKPAEKAPAEKEAAEPEASSGEAEPTQEAPRGGFLPMPGGEPDRGTRLAVCTTTVVPPWNGKRSVSEERVQ